MALLRRSKPDLFLLAAGEVQPVPGREGLFVLPGHVGFAEYESQLSIAHELSGSLAALQNIPGAIRWFIDLTAASIKADFVLIDMSPSLGSINQNLWATSDAFIIPMAPDYFSEWPFALWQEFCHDGTLVKVRSKESRANRRSLSLA
jgi:cellulose biosynthesis protein BcsQ